MIVRVVYDGPPEAGKTTTVRKISEMISPYRRGEWHNPEAVGARTEYFDWLDFGGGYVRGYHLRCQILSVPGQRTLLRRRRELLKSADTVVFVADSRAEALSANIDSYAQLNEVLRRREASETPVGLLIQANKQDVDSAMGPQRLASELRLPSTIPVLGSQAVVGGSVMDVFVVAIRLAVERAQRLFEGDGLSEPPEEAQSVEAQLRALRGLEVIPDSMDHGRSVSIQVPIAVSVPASEPKPAPEDEPSEPAEADSSAEADGTTEQAPPLEPERLSVPAAGEVPAGCLWPPLKGRSILAAVNGVSHIAVQERAAPWAPKGAVELQAENGWILHTSPRWRFENADEGRTELIAAVRGSLALGDLVPDGRTFLLAPDGERWRVWMITPDLPTLAESLARAVRSDGSAAIEEALRNCEAVLQRLPEGGESSPESNILEAMAVQHGKPVLLNPPNGAAFAAGGRSVLDAIRELILNRRREDPQLGRKLTQALRAAGIGDRLRELVHSVIENVPPAAAEGIATAAHDQSE